MNNLKIILVLLLVIGAISFLFDYLNHTYIKAEFNKMDPMPSKMGVLQRLQTRVNDKIKNFEGF